MAEEIERKFLVRGEAWRAGAVGSVFRQGYLSTVTERTVRVRVVGEHGYLTVKGITVGATRAEFEYDIPVDEAEALLRLCEQPIIEKTRHTVEYRGLHWEIDEFEGANRGLIVAEVELAAADAAFARPDWVGDEVTDDPRYFNSNLVAHPYTTW